jgi:hypothetical protein
MVDVLQVKCVRWRIAPRLFLWIAVTFLAGSMRSGAEPTAQEILQHARMNEMVHRGELQGRLRSGPKTIPFFLSFDGGVIKYEFTNPKQTIVLRLGDRSSRLEEITGGGTSRVSEARFDERVRGTDITYEDLSLRFLYWPGATLVGEQILLTRNTWKLRLQHASSRDSQYGSVLLWVEKQSGALLRADGYDWNGNFVKRFEVRSVQRYGGGWILKQMRIQTMADGGGKDRTPTYLEIEKPKDD